MSPPLTSFTIEKILTFGGPLKKFTFLIGLVGLLGWANFAQAVEDFDHRVRTVTIATEGTKFEPFKSFSPVFTSQSGFSLEVGRVPSGFEIELLQAIFKKMRGYRAVYIFNYDSAGEASFESSNPGEYIKKSKGPIDFAALFPGLSQKRKNLNGSNSAEYLWDMTIATTGITQERRDKFQIEFSRSYFTPIKHFFAKSNFTNFPFDLSGKRVGVKVKTLFFKYVDFVNAYLVQQGKAPIEIVTYDDVSMPAYDKILAALKAGEIDMTLNDDEVLLKAKMSDSGLANFNLVGPNLFEAFGKEQFGEGTGVAFRNTDLKLISDFNSALSAVIRNCYSGGYKSIYKKYFKADSTIIAHCK